MEWPVARLGHLCDIVIGATPARNRPEYWGGHHVWVTVGELNGGVVTDSREHITDEGVANSSSKLIPAGTLLFSFKLSIGKMAFAGVDLYTNEAIAALQIRRTSVLDPRYLYYCLSSIDTVGNVDVAAKGKVLNKSKLRDLRIPLPPFSEQRRIVEILDQADRLRRLRAEADAKADHILPALFIKMFGDPATNPMGWPVVPLRQLGRPLSGGAFPLAEQGVNDGQVPFIKVSDMNTEGNEWFIRHANNYVSPETLERLKVKPAPAGTIVFPKIGAAVATNKKRLLVQDTAYDNNVIGVVPRDVRYSAYLFGFFQLFDLRTLARSTALPSIKASELALVPIPKPPQELAVAFEARFDELSQALDATARGKRRIEDLFKLLMHRAFSGSLTASWREAHMKELLREMEQQARALEAANG